jgi:cytochrome c oxidase subunit 4
MTVTAHEETVHGTGHTHPTDGNYMIIAVILAAITAAEVSLYYIDIGSAMIPALLVMMAVKFAIVVAYFMHLRFDSLLFRRIFVGGLVLAVLVYIAALVSMEFWGNSKTIIHEHLPSAGASK